MPTVVRLVTGLFGNELHPRLNPDEVVALGAGSTVGAGNRT
jgi:molecular chaperone DnaK (HSP70)